MEITIISSSINYIDVTDNHSKFPEYIKESIEVEFMLNGIFRCSCKIFYNGRDSINLLADIEEKLKESIK